MKKQLVEVNKLKSFIQSVGSIFTAPSEKKEKSEKSSMEKIGDSILKSVLDVDGIKKSSAKTEKSEESYIKKVPISIGKEKGIVRLLVIYSSGSVSVTLWEKDDESLIDVLCIGTVDQKYRLKVVGSERLKTYV